MKKSLLFFTLLTVAVLGFAQDAFFAEMRETSLRIISSDRPVDAIRTIDDPEMLLDFQIFAQVSRIRGNPSNLLNEADSFLIEHLARLEFMRREASPAEFSRYLQEMREEITPRMREASDIANAFIRINSWIDQFQLTLMLGN